MRLLILVPLVLCAACIVQPVVHTRFGQAPNELPSTVAGRPKKIAVFFDGTSNDSSSQTNVWKLHQYVTAHAGDSISTVYIEGVGTNSRWFGQGFGFGIEYDVKQAYYYLGETFNAARGDQIYIFGFSRGAYAARILTGLLYAAGVHSLANVPRKRRADYVLGIFQGFEGDRTYDKRRARISRFTRAPKDSARVQFLGIWETVDALGLAKYRVDVDEVNPRYGDQLCNVDRAAHAMSLDDNRYRIFTPVLLTRRHLLEYCPRIWMDTIVNEVWFAGAHSDVGGGYKDTRIHGVSLNWMLAQVRRHQLAPDTVFAENAFDKTHDAEEHFKTFYKEGNRDLAAYLMDDRNMLFQYRVHNSVFERLDSLPRAQFESRWFAHPFLRPCFRPLPKGLVRFTDAEDCPIRRVGNESVP